MTDPRDLQLRGQQYRNYDPNEFVEEFEKNLTQQERVDLQDAMRGALVSIESGRLEPFLANTSKFFDRLDTDEQELFTRRNPDLVQWTSVWQRASGLDPMNRWYDLAASLLTGTITRRRTGMPEKTFNRILETAPPPFERQYPSSDVDALFEDMLHRRRSYRNWSPYEFMDLLEQDRLALTAGEAREVGWQTPEIREEIEFPIEVHSDEVVRPLLGRIEAGRFRPILSTGLKASGGIYGPLDPDERGLFARRNPGIIMWLSVWGESNALINREQMLTNTGVEWPTL